MTYKSIDATVVYNRSINALIISPWGYSMSAEFFNVFLKSLAAHISGAVKRRCFARADLISILVRIRTELAVPGHKQTTGVDLLNRLVDSGVAQAVPVEAPSAKKAAQPGFYLFGLGATVESLHPVELLLARQPGGVICDFTALWMHALTTQVPPHHHVAILDRRPAVEQPRLPRKKYKGQSSKRARNPLGTSMFSFQGVPYYQTHRIARRMPGVQTRYLTDSTVFLVTNREQSLLNSLHYPGRCGGPPVVYEAWDTGLELLDEELLLEQLVAIDDKRLGLKVGYMLEQRGCKPAEKLQDYFDAAREAAAREDPYQTAPLLRGYHFTNIDSRWHLEVP